MKKYFVLLGLLLLPVIVGAELPPDPLVNTQLLDLLVSGTFRICFYCVLGIIFLFFIALFTFKKQRKLISKLFSSFMIVVYMMYYAYAIYPNSAENIRKIGAYVAIFTLASAYLLYEFIKLGIWVYRKLFHKSQKENKK